jgi:hypothetical protein
LSFLYTQLTQSPIHSHRPVIVAHRNFIITTNQHSSSSTCQHRTRRSLELYRVVGGLPRLLPKRLAANVASVKRKTIFLIIVMRRLRRPKRSAVIASPLYILAIAHHSGKNVVYQRTKIREKKEKGEEERKNFSSKIYPPKGLLTIRIRWQHMKRL